MEHLNIDDVLGEPAAFRKWRLYNWIETGYPFGSGIQGKMDDRWSLYENSLVAPLKQGGSWCNCKWCIQERIKNEY